MVSWLLIIVDRPIPYVWVDLPQRFISSLFVLVFFLTCMSLSLLMISPWVSSRRSCGSLPTSPKHLGFSPNLLAYLQHVLPFSNSFHFLNLLYLSLDWLVSWLSLIIRSGNILFNTTLYKIFKGKFSKFFVELEGLRLFLLFGPIFLFIGPKIPPNWRNGLDRLRTSRN